MAVKLALNSKEDYNLDQEVCSNKHYPAVCFISSLVSALLQYIFDFYISQDSEHSNLRHKHILKNSTACTLVGPKSECVRVCFEGIAFLLKIYMNSVGDYGLSRYVCHI